MVGDWIGGWDSSPGDGGGALPANRKAALAVCCGGCGSIAVRVRSSAEGSRIVWIECTACKATWKESISLERAIIVSVQSTP